jgi:uncharacterized damage-inducible protein DinB
LSLIAGYVALYAAKGATLHRKAGIVFVYAMLVMSLLGSVLAIRHQTWVEVNVPAGLLTAYLVITSLTTLRREPGSASRWTDFALMLLALSIGATCLVMGFEAIAAGGKRNGIPAFPFLLFGSIGTLAATLDFRMIRAGGLRGVQRLRRHLWRMSFALFIAAMSFFLGQAKVIPKPIRIYPLLAVPVFAVLFTMLFWLWRVRARNTSTTKGETKMRALIQTVLMLLLTVVIRAQDVAPAANPATVHTKYLATSIQKILLRTAGQMPEEKYGFRPVETVRTFGQIVGHLADSQYGFCSRIKGEKSPAQNHEKTATSKAQLIAALEQSFAYCNSVYATLTDDSAQENVKLMGSDTPRIGVVQINNVHSIEHYGNLVTYMRLQGLVPPTSDPDFLKSLSRR